MSQIPADRYSVLERIRWLEAIQKDSEVDACATALAAVLCVAFDKATGETFRSIASLSKLSKRSQTATKKAIRQLRDRGWIEVVRRKSRDGDWDHNLYRMVVREAHCAPPRSRRAPGEARNVLEVGRPLTDGRAHSAPNPSSLSQSLSCLAPWQEALERAMAPAQYRTWIVPLRLKEVHAQTAILLAPNTGHRDWVLAHYEHDIRASVGRFHPGVQRIEVVADECPSLTPASRPRRAACGGP